MTAMSEPTSTTTSTIRHPTTARGMAMARRLIREGRAQAFRELYGCEPPERTMPSRVTKWNARGGA